jgi:hypothetical protein
LSKFSRRRVPHLLFPAQKVARVQASTEILLIRHESEENRFEGIATGDDSWFQYSYPSSKTFAQSPTDVIPRTRSAMGEANYGNDFLHQTQTNGACHLTKRKQSNQLSFVDYVLPDLKRENVNFHRQIPQATF